MSGDSECLLVVAIIEGRHFPKLKNNEEVYVEAKFGNKSLATDAVPAAEKPSFNCELVFELFRKDLQLHRLNRTPIKLQLFTKGSTTGVLTSPVGQIVLDLKQAKDYPTEPAWFPILHCKHRGSRPDLLISFYLETPKRHLEHVPSSEVYPEKRNQSIPETHPDPRLASPVLPVQKESISDEAVISDQQISLMESGDYYIFNQDGDVGRMFRLTVTLVFAERLELLEIPSSSGPFIFYYYLLGNKVCSEPFTNLEQPEFPAERATVRLKCLRATINKYILELKNLEVFLASRAQGSIDSVIGKAFVPLLTLLSDGVAEGIYPIGDNFQNIPLQNAPCVGLSLSLQLEESGQSVSSSPKSHASSVSQKSADEKTDGTNISDNKFKTSEPAPSPSVSESLSRNSKNSSEKSSKISEPTDVLNASTNTGASDSLKDASYNKGSENVDIKDKESKEIENQGYNERLNTNGKNFDKEAENIVASRGTSPKHRNIVKPNHRTREKDHANAQTMTKTDPPVGTKKDDNVGNLFNDTETHFCLSIDLRHIRFSAPQLFRNCSIRYRYPFVGASDMIETMSFSPSLRKTVIPDGQHTFCFVTSFSRLRKAFSKLPLTLELACDNTLVCLAYVYLEPLLNAPSTFFSQSERVKGYRSTVSCKAVFTSQKCLTVAKMSVYLSLDRLDGRPGGGCAGHVLPRSPNVNETQKCVHALMPKDKLLRQPTEAELRVSYL